MSNYSGPTQNFVYADVDGHIGYYGAGKIPIRKSGDGSVPYDGSTDDGEWTSYIPFDKLPHSFDPPSGIIVTANQRVVGRDYQYFLSHNWAPPYRARRIFDLLSAKPKLTIDDFRRVQGDVYSIANVTFARAAAKTLKAAPASGAESVPGAVRGPRAGSPRGVVVATGSVSEPRAVASGSVSEPRAVATGSVSEPRAVATGSVSEPRAVATGSVS